MSDSESDSDMDVENERFSSSGEETGGSDDDSDREDGFLNIPLACLMHICVHCYSRTKVSTTMKCFMVLLSLFRRFQTPTGRTQREYNVLLIVPYDRQAGPTFNEPPGAGKPSDYFSLLLEDRFLGQVRMWTNDNATTKIRENPERNKTPWKDIESIGRKLYFLSQFKLL